MKTFKDCIRKSEQLEKLGISLPPKEIAKIHAIWTPGEETYRKVVSKTSSIEKLWSMWEVEYPLTHHHQERRDDIILLRILELATTQEERHRVYRVSPMGSEVYRKVVLELCKA